MESEEKVLIQEETPKESSEIKSVWQLQKESWYDKIPVTQKQLDIIIVVCLMLLVLTFVVIFLDAKDIFNPFGY